MLKRAALVIALTCGFSTRAFAATDALVVGSVRGDDGAAIVDADVRFVDAWGAAVAFGRTDGFGTFAIEARGGPLRVEVRCPHCRATSQALGSETNLAIVVTRYRAVESDALGARDLAALPYGNLSDLFALVPFVLGGGNGARNVSDRGLGGARGLESDDGATLVDLATGTSLLSRIPYRFASGLDIVRADRAYRYGAAGGGGVFAFDSIGARTRVSLDGGAPSSLDVAPVVGNLHPAFGISRDDGALAARGDIDLVTGFAGGTLRAGLTAATQNVETTDPNARYLRRGARIGYATAARRFRTFVNVSLDEIVVVGTREYRSSYATADVRLERPGAVALATGIRATQQTASYASGVGAPYALTGRSNVGALYIEAESSMGNVRAHGALALASVGTNETFPTRTLRDQRYRVLPEIDARIDLGLGAYVRSGYSRAARVPTLLEIANAATPADGAPFESSELIENALGIDPGGRVRAEAIAYREGTRDRALRRLDGIGASVAWQIAPRVSLRAWTLRATYAPAPQIDFDDATRGLFWATYENANAFRIDAIVHRDVRGIRPAIFALDGDALFPVAPHVALDLGTTRRGDTRRFSIGLRSH